MGSGRKKSIGAAWFKHDANASMDEKILDLEGQFGLIGYALYFKFLEVLTRSDDYEIEWNDRKCGVMARHFGVTKDELNVFIVAATIGNNSALLLQDGYLFSPGLKKRLDPLQEKRDREALRQKINREILAATTSQQLDLLQQQYQLSEQQKQLLTTLREEKRREEKRRGELLGDGQKNPDKTPTDDEPEKNNPGLYTSIFYELETMKKSNYWGKVREMTCQWSGKSPTTDTALLSSGLHKYNLWLIEKREWTKGVTPEQFAAGLSKWIMNEKQKK